jgi:biopolymer transport protein ExbB
MMKRILALLIVGVSATAFAQSSDPERATSLDELLAKVRAGNVREAREHRERLQRFEAAKAEQQQLLRQARQTKRSRERDADQLERQFERNELRVAELAQTLDNRLGSLKEMFGVLQQVTGDTRGLLENSVITAQYPERVETLGELVSIFGSSSKLASLEDFEQLWFELHREMTESGRVVRFSTTVTTADGEKIVKDVARVGSFNIVTDGKYLQYIPETGNVLELPRQPQARFVKSTEDVMEASTGSVGFGIDPSRGSLLGLLVQAPSLRERIAQGGLIGYLTISLGILAMLIALERVIILGIEGQKVRSQLKNHKQPKKSNPLGRVLLAAEKHRGTDLDTLELKMGEAILREIPRLNRALLFLKIIAVVAPLMGLLGTVTGMINTFQAITLFGTGDPKLMAGGISQALVTTVIGLCVAIPTVLLHTVVSVRSKRIVHVLEEQSTGIVAEIAEENDLAPAPQTVATATT